MVSKSELSKVYGKIQVVDSFPDYKVKVVSSFADMHVKVVQYFPDSEGKWKFVESFPDFKIQFVESFPDFTIKFVDSFPSVKINANLKDVVDDKQFIDLDWSIVYRIETDRKVYEKKVESGKELKLYETQQQPSIYISREPFKYYAIIMFDPDTSSGNWLHWLIINYRIAEDGEDIWKDEIIEYMKPTPSPWTGYHRYIFLVYGYNKIIESEDVKVKSRKGFHIKKFESELGLGNPISAVYFKAQNEKNQQLIDIRKTLEKLDENHLNDIYNSIK